MSFYDSKTSEELFWQGVELFNKRQFFDCHEIFEALWNRELEPEHGRAKDPVRDGPRRGPGGVRREIDERDVNRGLPGGS